MSGHFPALGFDPAPGELASMDGVARTIGESHRALEEIDTLLRGAAHGHWEGDAAIAFRDLLDHDLRPRIREAVDSFRGADTAMSDWASRMRVDQAQARRLEVRAAEAQAAIRFAHQSRSLIPLDSPWDLDPAVVERRRQNDEERARWDRKAHQAERDLAQVHHEARNLEHAYRHFADQIAARLRAAMALAPNEPGFWDRLGELAREIADTVIDLAKDLNDWALKVLAEIAPYLETISEIASVLSMVCGLLAFVPGLQGLGVVAVALGGLSLLTGALADAGKAGSWSGMLTVDNLISLVTVAVGGAAIKAGGKAATAAWTAGKHGHIAEVTKVLGKGKVAKLLNGNRIYTPPGFFATVRHAGTMDRLPFITKSVYVGGWTIGQADTIGHAPDNAKSIFKLATGQMPFHANKPMAVSPR